MSEIDTPDTLRDDLRTAWHRYIDMLVPLRPALYGYCRRLAGNVWEAEDLAQDTLLRAFGQWGVTYPPIRNPRAYLLRIATRAAPRNSSTRWPTATTSGRRRPGPTPCASSASSSRASRSSCCSRPA